MDGLPGMQRALVAAKRESVAPIKKMVGPLAPQHYRNTGFGFALHQVLLVALLAFLVGMLAASYGSVILRHARATSPRQGQVSMIRAALWDALRS